MPVPTGRELAPLVAPSCTGCYPCCYLPIISISRNRLKAAPCRKGLMALYVLYEGRGFDAAVAVVVLRTGAVRCLMNLLVAVTYQVLQRISTFTLNFD